MRDIARICWLEEQCEQLSEKIERWEKHNRERGQIGREGMFDQINIRIRIWTERKKAMLEEIEELKKDDS